LASKPARSAEENRERADGRRERMQKSLIAAAAISPGMHDVCSRPDTGCFALQPIDVREEALSGKF